MYSSAVGQVSCGHDGWMDGLHLLSLSLIEQKIEPKVFLNSICPCDYFASPNVPFLQNIYPTTKLTKTTTIPAHNILSTPLLLPPDILVVCAAPKHSKAFLEFSSVEFDSALDMQLMTELSPLLVTLQYW